MTSERYGQAHARTETPLYVSNKRAGYEAGIAGTEVFVQSWVPI